MQTMLCKTILKAVRYLGKDVHVFVFTIMKDNNNTANVVT